MALAMLPAGALVTLASVIGFLAVAALAVAALVERRPGWGWTELWCLVALAMALRNARAGIEMVSAFDWRPLPLALLLSVAVVASWLYLP